jgi:hypothetical protein
MGDPMMTEAQFERITDDKPWLRFRTPRRDQGQIVEHSYATDLQDCLCWERVEDRSDRSVRYASRPLSESEIDREECCELGDGSW